MPASPSRAALVVLLAVTSVASMPARAPAQPPGPVVVVLMTGFLAGPNPGLQILDGKLQAAFGGMGAPALAAQVFTHLEITNAAAWIASQGAIGRLVLIGHSLGAESTFNLATSHLGPGGLTADLAIALDYVALASPFAPTTPTVPAAIATAHNFHQQSTGVLEPVPASTIIGARRNLSMEFLFGDATITHTSIDCDDRVHARVINRIRELVLPTPYPGTDEDLDLLCRIDQLVVPCQPVSGIAAPGFLADTPVQPVAAGQWITVRAVTPEATFAGSAFGILGEAYVTALPPASVFPGIAVSLLPPYTFLLTPSGFQFPPAAFAPFAGSAFTAQVCWPPNAQGLSVLLQAVVVDPAAANGLFASSAGVELRGI